MRSGVYSAAGDRFDSRRSTTRSRKVGGQWRISELPNGIVLSRDNFENSFSEYPLYFFDPDFRYLVPDVRWFPNCSGTVADRIVNALLAGPSNWLQGGVVTTAFPADVKVGDPSRRQERHCARRSQLHRCEHPNLVRARMLRQLQESLSTAEHHQRDDDRARRSDRRSRSPSS